MAAMAGAEAGGGPAAPGLAGPRGSLGSSETTSLKEDGFPYSRMLPVDRRLLNLQIYKLLQCVHQKDKKQIEKLVQKGFPNLINYTEPKEGYSAFHLASMKNDIEMCRFLLEQGAHPNVHDTMGRTPAMRAAELGHEVVLELLAKADADMTAVDNEGKGILFYCLLPTRRHSHCLHIALKYGADVNNCTTEGRSVLLQACEQAHEIKEMCLAFLERGASPHARDPATGRTAVMEAAREGAVEVVRALLTRGADVNLFDFERHSAAHFAAKGGFFEILKSISAYNGDLKLIAMNGNTPLHYAAEGGFADCCKYIGQRGCDPTWRNLLHLTPREAAKNGGFKAAVTVLRKIEKGFKKNLSPEEEASAWHLKLYDWSLEHEDSLRKEFEALLQEDGMVTRADFVSVIQKQWSFVGAEEIENIAKMHEVQPDRINLDEFFKGSKYLDKNFLMSSFGPKVKKQKKGAKAKGKKGLPVPVCVIPKREYPRGEEGLPVYLVEAFPIIPDEERFKRDHPSAHPVHDDRVWYLEEPRKTYMDINYLVRAGDIVSLQKAFEEGVPVDIKDKYYKTPLMVACASGNVVLVELLLEKGADVNMTDNFLWTPLHHACSNGHLDIAELLVKAGAAVDALGIGNTTPLMRAIEACRLDIVYFLITAGANIQITNSNGKNALDIAKVFDNAKIIDLLQNLMDNLAEPEEEAKMAKGGKPKSSEKKESPEVSLPAVEKPVPGLTLRSRKASARKPLVTKERNKDDISFKPRKLWSPDAATMELVRKQEFLRERAAICGHLEGFTTLFNRKFKD
ncbi:ankyrin repeat and EF-hand domain-containing protein 1 isoform X1 [Corapipo altera]|uniref:ankyrin repeat and EF-hand domain-containing protein 1 isoform X1 n=2 Tax=Corapipo altera TaxID=415028 RepID=UPI000FD638B9|nr:ankyrin repeat and EF-hand domain-containing protein 1 isoform X1 [Corapipo altera]